MTDTQLARLVGVPGAVLMGLGSIVGTGIFVSIGIAAGVAGPVVIFAVVLAAIVATFNGLSSAQLAASHPVSGGTYEYGYRYLNPTLGFIAGWLFLCAKSASAATAALGFASYALAAFGVDSHFARIGLGVATVAVLTMIVSGGITRSSRTNIVIVSITLISLTAFIVAGVPTTLNGLSTQLHLAMVNVNARDLLHATALMFVAFTGYGRIATLGEEVQHPKTTIPRAIVLTLLATMVLYLSIVLVAIGTVGGDTLASITRSTGAPLEVVAQTFAHPQVRYVVAVAAVTAMLGVLLNLLLGLSRVFFAMARRGDMPPALAKVDQATASPRLAVVVTGSLIAALTLIGSVKTTWSFSAFTVLIYYAITNLAALSLPLEHRRYSRWISALGLASCLGLAFWVEPIIWLVGLALIGVGLGWKLFAERWRLPASS